MRILAFALLLSVAVMACAQTSAPAATPPYRFLNLVSNDSLTEKLNQYGASGYRFLGLSAAEGGATSVIMERTDGGPYEYRIASGPWIRSRFSDELRQAGEAGFCIVNGTLRQQPSNSFLRPPTLTVMMEKTPASGGCEVLAIAAILRKNMTKNMLEAYGQGFAAVEVTKDGSMPIVLMQRKAKSPAPASAASAAPDPLQLVEVGDMDKREQKLLAATAMRYRVNAANYSWRGNQPPEFVALLEAIPTKPEYRLVVNDLKVEKNSPLLDQQIGAFESQMNELAAKGFRLSGSPWSRIHYTGWAKPWRELSSLMEKTDIPYEYRIVTAEDTPELSRKIAELHAKGFRVTPQGLLGSENALMERPLKKAE